MEAVPEDVARGVGARPRRPLVAQHRRLDRARAAARPPGLEEPCILDRAQTRLVVLLLFSCIHPPDPRHAMPCHAIEARRNRQQTESHTGVGGVLDEVEERLVDVEDDELEVGVPALHGVRGHAELPVEGE